MKGNTLVSSVHFPSIAICTIGIAVLLALRRHLPKEEYTKKQYDSQTTTNTPLVFVLVILLGVLFVGILCSRFYYYSRHAKPWMEKDKRTKKYSKKPTTSLEYKFINPQDVGDRLGKLLETLLLLTRETDQTNYKKNKKEEIGVLEQEILKLFQILIQHCGDHQCQTKKRQGSNQRRKYPTLLDESSLELTSQQAAFAVLQYYPYCDELLSSCFTLLALLAKKESVRQRILQSHLSSYSSSRSFNTPIPTNSMEHVVPNNQSSQLLLNVTSFSIGIPLHAMKESLCRAKQIPSSQQQEQISSAEVQRKGSVFLGAIADGNSDIVVSILQANGLDILFEAMEWFRFHSHVANWSLWTLFIWTYHCPPTISKLQFVVFLSGNSTTTTHTKNGLERICRVMKDLPK